MLLRYPIFKTQSFLTTSITTLLSPLLIFFSVFFFTFGLTPLVKAQNTLSSLTIELDAEKIASLGESQRRAILAIKDAAESELSYWSQYDLELPTTFLMGTRGQIIEVGNLFRNPSSSDELSQLAQDKDGNPIPISNLPQESLDKLDADALIVIPSKNHPGKFHVWKVNILLLKGRKNIKITWDKWKSRALRQIKIETPARFVGNGKLSVRSGVRNFYKGLRNTLASIIGLVDLKPKYDFEEVRAIVQEERKSYSKAKIQSRPGIDLRLYDDDLIKEILPILHQIHQDTFSNEDNSELRAAMMTWEEELRPLYQSDPETAEYEMFEKRNRFLQDRFYSRIRLSAELEQLSPGIAELIVNHAIALEKIYETERKISSKYQKKRENEIARLKEEHPVQSKDTDWLDTQVTTLLKKWYDAQKWLSFTETSVALDSLGLVQEANILRANIEFLKEKETKLKSEIEAENTAARSFQDRRLIWNPKNWVVTWDEKKEQHRLQFSTPGPKVETSTPGWRLLRALHRTGTYWKNGLFMLVYLNWWNGPYGIKSQFLRDPFQASVDIETIDRENYRVVPGGEYRETYVSRFEAIKKHFDEKKDQYWKDYQPGILPKWLEGGWFNFVNGTKRWGSYIAHGLSQPTLTTLNTAVTGLGGVTSFVWAPLSSLTALGFNALIYDFDSPYHHSDRPDESSKWFPIFNNILMKALFKGVGTGTVSAFAGTFVHPTLAASALAYGGTTRTVRSGWETFWRETILRWGNLPSRNLPYIVQRVSGPGLAQNYYYQIDPALAVTSIQVAMEADVLHRWRRLVSNEIATPMENYDLFFKQIGEAFSIEIGSITKPNELEASTKSLNHRLASLADPRKSAYNGLLGSRHRDQIRLRRESLDEVLAQSAQLTRAYYKEVVLSKLNENDRDRFWRDKHLDEEDWVGLVRFYLRKAFSSSIVDPIEESDHNVHIPVSSESLEVALARDFSQIIAGSDPTPIVVERPKLEKERNVATKYPSYLSITCPDLLVSSEYLKRYGHSVEWTAP